jgi:hypothetical protein
MIGIVRNTILMVELDPRYTYYGNIIINPILMAKIDVHPS